MKLRKTRFLAAGLAAAVILASAASAAGVQSSAGESAAKLLIGQVQEINGTQVTLKLESGHAAQGLGQGTNQPDLGQSADGQQMAPPFQDQQTAPQDGMGGPQSGGMPDSMGGPQGGMGQPSDGQPPAGNGTPPDAPEGAAPGTNESIVTLDLSGAEILVETEPGSTQAGSLADIDTGDILMVQLDDSGNPVTATVKNMSVLPGRPGEGSGQPGGMPGQPGGASGVDSYNAVTEYTSDTAVSNQSFSSAGTDENAILVSDGAVTLDKITVSRVSSDSTGGDTSSFYGVGAAVLTTDGTVTISDSKITTDAAGGAGVFAYGSGVAYVSDSTITTAKGTSGGIHAAGGGTLYASDLDVTTQGGSSAAIRSDRGGGLMVVDGGSYVSNGTGSPAVYSTANISVRDAELTANRSEAVCIEGLNALYLYDCDLTGYMPDDKQNDCTWTVIVYQSMSGDSQIGCGTYQMVGGTLISKNGGLFYTTNTESNILLKDVNITTASDCEFFLRCMGNQNARGWGSVGKNGADCTFTAISQEMIGDVIWDSISELDFYMTDGSSLTGAFLNDESCAGNGGSGYANLYLGEDSTWVVTGNSALSGLHQAGKIVDAQGNTVTIKDSSGTVYVQGNSAYTVTVSSYTAPADLSGAASVTAWEDSQVNSGSADSGVPGAPGGNGTNNSMAFTDVAAGAYYYDAVRWAVERSITVGTSNSTFSPDTICTRAQIITFLWRAAGSPKPGSAVNPFTDVAENAYYYKAALWASEQGMTTGTMFYPDQPCTRGMTVLLLWKAAGSPSTAAATGFADVDAQADYAQAVAWAAASGVTVGTSATTFSPNDTCTRGQIATFLYRSRTNQQ